MKKERIKFKNTLFKKKVDVITSSSEDYEYLVNTLNFDPVYFISDKITVGSTVDDMLKYPANKIKTDDITQVFYMEDCGFSFAVEFTPISKVTFKRYRDEEAARFIYRDDNNRYFLITAVADM